MRVSKYREVSKGPEEATIQLTPPESSWPRGSVRGRSYGFTGERNSVIGCWEPFVALVAIHASEFCWFRVTHSLL